MKTIYHNGKVYTGQLPLQQAFIVEDGHFSFVGSDAQALMQKADAVIDLDGQFVCPGFIDSHMHLLGMGQTLSIAMLHLHTTSMAEMLACLATTKPGRGGWILGRGWNQDLFQDVRRMPDRHDLDRVSTTHPVCAVRACGHALSVNTKALEMLGITASTPQIEGGQIVMEAGSPNGIFLDNAMELVMSAIPHPTKDDIKDMLRTAIATLNSLGITSCHSDDYSTLPGLPWQVVNQAYRELEAEESLTVRVYEQANFTNISALREFVEAGNRTGCGTDRFRIGPLKLLGDGALGARTAYLSAPYADDPSTCGLNVFTQEQFDGLIGYANSQDMQVAVHCIGDGCLDMVLSSIEKALADHPRQDPRHGIVHCQITRPDQLEKIAGMGLHVYAQSIFLDYDIHIVKERVGEELAKSSYSWKRLKNSGCSVSNGSDCPVEFPYVMSGIQCAVTRKDLRGFGPYLEEEAFTVQEALDSYTYMGAHASFEEAIKGRIAPGFLADFTVLGSDPFSVNEDALKNIPVLATFLGGKQVFKA